MGFCYSKRGAMRKRLGIKRLFQSGNQRSLQNQPVLAWKPAGSNDHPGVLSNKNILFQIAIAIVIIEIFYPELSSVLVSSRTDGLFTVFPADNEEQVHIPGGQDLLLYLSLLQKHAKVF